MRKWSVGLVACLVGVLPACGAEVDLSKKTFPRSTVPAASDLGGGSTNGGAAATGDEAFASKNLRLVDPCGLLNDKALSAFGTPAKSDLRDYSRCSNYMKDKSGKDFNLSLTIGESVTGTSAEGSFKIGGLPANESELDDKSACFIKVITETSPKRAIVLQLGGASVCEPGRKLMTDVIEQVRAGAPLLTLAKGSMVNLEPCDVLDASVVTATIGDGVEGRTITSLHDCDWNGDGSTFSVGFKIGTPPDELADSAKTTPVDLGGVTAQMKHETSSGDRCRVEWAHAPFPPDKEQAEIVTIEYNRYSDKAGDDTCAKAEAAAKALLPKLPAA
jgi:hypothetical protein